MRDLLSLYIDSWKDSLEVKKGSQTSLSFMFYDCSFTLNIISIYRELVLN